MKEQTGNKSRITIEIDCYDWPNAIPVLDAIYLYLSKAMDHRRIIGSMKIETEQADASFKFDWNSSMSSEVKK